MSKPGGKKKSPFRPAGLFFASLLLFIILAQIGRLSATEVLPQYSLLIPQTQIRTQSPYYKVRPEPEKSSEPGFLKFYVTAAHAIYKEEGLVPLKKLLHEIEVIEKIKNHTESPSFVNGAVDSVTGTGKGLVNLVIHPVNSVKGVGKAAGELGRSVGSNFRDQEPGEETDFQEKVIGHWERQVAQNLGVDVYTTNPFMKEILVEKAKGRMSGKGAVLVGQLFIPGGILVSGVLAAGNINSTADRVVNDQSRRELYRLNKEALQRLWFAEKQINDFLNNPFYTPRQATYLRFYLEKLQPVTGYRDIFKTALEADTLWKARKILYEAQMAADSYQDKSTYERLECFEEGLAIIDKDRVIFITPYDYLDASPFAAGVTAKALEVKTKWQKPSLEIWNGGKVTVDFDVDANAHGIKTRSWLLI